MALHITAMAHSSLIYDSCIQGYHEYKSIWDASVGEVLHCISELYNPYDDQAVLVARRKVTVGHMPRYVSRGFLLLLQLGGSITATVNSTRRYSRDLSQEGLETPCQYTVEGPTNEVKKIMSLSSCKSNYELVKSDSGNDDDITKTVPAKTEPQVSDRVQTAATSCTAGSDETILETIVVQQNCVGGEKSTECNDIWVMLERVVLKLDDKNILLNES